MSSIEEAQQQWSSWEKDLDADPDIFHVTVGGVLHIRVAIRLLMDYVSSTIRQNRVDATVKTQKKAVQSDIDRAMAQSSLHLNKVAGAKVDLAAPPDRC